MLAKSGMADTRHTVQSTVRSAPALDDDSKWFTHGSEYGPRHQKPPRALSSRERLPPPRLLAARSQLVDGTLWPSRTLLFASDAPLGPYQDWQCHCSLSALENLDGIAHLADTHGKKKRRVEKVACMPDAAVRVSRVTFRNFKALADFSLSLSDMNLLVGPNNSGKSTIIPALRVLDNGIRFARTRAPGPVFIGEESEIGYRLPEDSIPISLENIHTNYDATEFPCHVPIKQS